VAPALENHFSRFDAAGKIVEPLDRIQQGPAHSRDGNRLY